MQFKRTCPKCGLEIFHSTQHILNQSVKGNRLCKSCSNRETNRKKIGTTISESVKKQISVSKTGKKPSLETITKLSIGQKNRYLKIEEREKTSNSVKLAMHNPDIRKKHIEGLTHSPWLKVRTDKGQLEFINKINEFGFNFEPNYQIKTDTDLFYVDGYDKKRNIVLEFDSKYHKRKQQMKKDLERQSKILNILKPNVFWRYDNVSDTMKNIIQG